MAEYVRVTDDVKPRREYTVLASQVTDAHKVLDKPGTYPNGDPLPPKYAPRTQTTAPTGAAKKSGGRTPAGDKE